MTDKCGTVCFKCERNTGKLMRCKECGTTFCGECFPPLSLDSGVIADKIDICPKCDSREIDYLN